jgi:hypothetical protein
MTHIVAEIYSNSHPEVYRIIHRNRPWEKLRTDAIALLKNLVGDGDVYLTKTTLGDGEWVEQSASFVKLRDQIFEEDHGPHWRLGVRLIPVAEEVNHADQEH